MWILIIYIGISHTLGQVPSGAPTSAEFSTQQACQAALAQIQSSFGEQRPFDQRFQHEAAEGGDWDTRIWTIKGVCVSQKLGQP